ncbi:MAG: radical SAM protein [Ndongobacter sp.]|nr:radical SAM protein [Ndongobacter sp.]
MIIQCTLGCANNTCTFCSMYRDKNFRMRPQEDIISDLRECAEQVPFIEKLFLADGDALVMPTARLLEIIYVARELFPYLRQITCYATAQDILRKSDEELCHLRKAGLDMLYVGLESGSNAILQSVHKNLTKEQFVEAGIKAKRAGLKLSVTLILGLGQKKMSEEHVRESAEAISLVKPEYVAFLSLQLDPAAPLYEEVRSGKFVILDDVECLSEMRAFLEQVDSEGTVFRSNHASNAVAVGGVLNREREAMIRVIDRAIESGRFRPRGLRGL